MRAHAATLTYRTPSRKVSPRAPSIRRADPSDFRLPDRPWSMATDDGEWSITADDALDRELARYEDTDGCPECMVARVVVLVFAAYAALLAWGLLAWDVL